MNQLESLEFLFNPGSVAVIGASRDSKKWGNIITKAIVESRYKGKVYLINQNGGEVYGIQTRRSITEIPEPVDLAVIGIPSRAVPQAVKDCIDCGIKMIVIVTAGFGETGEKGKEVEKRLVQMAKESGARIVGPNCLGGYNSAIDLNTSILSITPGPLGFITQSGNFGLEVTYVAKRIDLGFSKFISIGNQVDLECHEYLHYLGNDKDTKAILIFIEGLKNGQKFLEVARQITSSKPVIAMKIGRTSTGRRSAKSHTGSLVGDDAIYDAAFKQAGIIRAKNSSELLHMGNAFVKLPLLRGNRIAIMTEGGGHATLASDIADSSGFEIPILSSMTQGKLAEFLLPQSSTQNPVDFAGAADEDLWTFVKCAEILLQDNSIDGLVIVGQFGGYYDIFPGAGKIEEAVATEMNGLVNKYNKPVVLHSMYARENPKSLDILQKQNIPVYESVESAISSMAALFQYSKYLDQKAGGTPSEKIMTISGDNLSFCRALLQKTQSEKRLALTEPEARNLIKRFGIPINNFFVVTTAPEAAFHAQKLGFPVALKIVSRDIVHKTEAKGVMLGLNDEMAVQEGFKEIIRNAHIYNPDAVIEGALVTPMETKGIEVIIGATIDETFGHCLMFGMGGIFVEAVRDISFRVAPIMKDDAIEMIKEIRGYPLLQGVRGQPAVDIEAIAEILLKVSQIIIQFSEISDLDLNPVFVYAKGASVIDARIAVTPYPNTMVSGAQIFAADIRSQKAHGGKQ